MAGQGKNLVQRAGASLLGVGLLAFAVVHHARWGNKETVKVYDCGHERPEKVGELQALGILIITYLVGVGIGMWLDSSGLVGQQWLNWINILGGVIALVLAGGTGNFIWTEARSFTPRVSAAWGLWFPGALFGVAVGASPFAGGA